MSFTPMNWFCLQSNVALFDGHDHAGEFVVIDLHLAA